MKVHFKKKNKQEQKVRRPGIEPGSTAWKAAMLTTIPPTLYNNRSFSAFFFLLITGHTAEITKLLVHPSEPLLVSSSLDKTIRIWNFDTCAQTFKLETVEEIIDMELLSNDLLYYRSDHHVKIWSLNLFHSLFTVLSSRIRRWSRVKSPGYPARLLVHAEDGGVRLVSPVHGYELTTVLPITTMTADIVDVAHNPRQEKIYLVLSTREVLVFESDTNPCW